MFPQINTRKYSKFNDELRKSTLKIWQESVVFFNKVTNTTQHFSKEDKFDLKTRIQDAALGIADAISRAAYACSREEYEVHLKQAEECVYQTVSSLYVAQKWKMIHISIYEQISDEGGQLTKSFMQLSDQNFSSSQLN